MIAHARELGNALQDATRVMPVPDQAPYRVLAVYQGRRRPTAPDARRLMAALGESVGVPAARLAGQVGRPPGRRPAGYGGTLVVKVPKKLTIEFDFAIMFIQLFYLTPN